MLCKNLGGTSWEGNTPWEEAEKENQSQVERVGAAAQKRKNA